MATRAETFRSEQARQRAHEAAAHRQENGNGHGLTDGEAQLDDDGNVLTEGLLGSGHEGERGTGGREGRRSTESRIKDSPPKTTTQMFRTFAPSARHLKRT
jgi:hypothetical protein